MGGSAGEGRLPSALSNFRRTGTQPTEEPLSNRFAIRRVALDSPSTARRTSISVSRSWSYHLNKYPISSALFSGKTGEPNADSEPTTGESWKTRCFNAPRSAGLVLFLLPFSIPAFKELSAMSAEIMTIKELAAYLDLAEATLYKKVSNNEIPYAKLGNLLRFPKWTIDQWVSENTVKPPDALFDEFAKLQSRYHFKKWLESKGIDPAALTDPQLLDLLKKAIADLSPDTPKP